MNDKITKREIQTELLCSEFEFFFEKWLKNKELSYRDITYIILSKIKVEYCFENECVFNLIRELNYMVIDNLEQMFEDIRNFLSEDEEIKED